MSYTKQILNSIKAEDYYTKADLHIHTTCSDGKLTPEEIIFEAIKNNLEYISITDHNTVDAYKILEEEIGTNNLTVVKGVEFDCWYGYTLLHIIGYDIDLKNQALNELCAQNKAATEADIVRFFTKRKAKKVIDTIKQAGGIPILAHPACCWNINIKNMIKELVSFGLEGLEVYYPYKRHRGIIKFYSSEYIDQIADELNLIKTGGSDRH